MRLLCLLASLSVFAGLALAQNDRGTITGTVLDPGNAVVSGAAVTATNTETGAATKVASSETGNYTIPSLPVGTYSLTVESQGFKTSVQQGLRVQVAQVMRMDITLQVGSTSESITVQAEASLLKTENAEQSVNVSGARINSLPLNFGGGGGSTGNIRSIYAFNVLSPGVQGSGTGAVINGLPGNSFKVIIEGQTYTSGNDTGFTATVTQPSVDMIEEFSLQTSNYAAEFGQVAGGLYNFTTKSGTNTFHGSGYEYFTNEDLDAYRPFQQTYAQAHPRNRKNDFGGTLGGPVWIPKVYDGRNKTFFFFSYEMFRNKVLGTLGANTVPTALMRQGNFSEMLNTGRTLATDALNRPVIENAIYDPTTAQPLANGSIITTAFPGNVIPTQRLDSVALKVQALIPQPDTTDLIRNWFPDGSNTRESWIPGFKIDQNFSDNSKVSFYYSKQNQNQITNADGLPEPITGRRVQALYGHTARLNYDRTLSPTTLIHLGAGILRFNNPDSAPPGVLKYDSVGLLGYKGSATDPGGFPRLEGAGFSGISGAQGAGMGPAMGPSNANNYYDGTITGIASISRTSGNHTFKIGAEWRLNSWTDQNTRQSQGRLVFLGNETAMPYNQSTSFTGVTGNIGFPYASFILGLGNNAVVNAVQDPQWRKKAWGLYAQDTWKITRKLTLDYGLRWDLQGTGHEIHYRNVEFGANVINPKAGNLRGGLLYEGFGAGRCNCNFVEPYPYSIGPRLGLAYQLDSKTVLRAAWGVSYGDVPNYGYITNSTLFGVGFNSINFNPPGFGTPAFVLKDGLSYNRADLYTATLDPGAAAPTSTGATVNPPYFLDPNGARPPRIQNWNVSIQREIMRDLVVEAGYVANRGVWENNAGLANPNLNDYHNIYPQRGLDILNATNRTLLNSTLASSTASNAGYFPLYNGFPTSTTVASVLLRSFPQYSSVGLRWAPLGNSWYDSLQIKATKRYSHGLDATIAFTYSKTLSTGNNNDIFNRINSKARSNSDRPFIFNVGANYTTPTFSRNRWVRNIAGQWTVSALLTYQSGSLIGVPGSNNQLAQVTLQGTRMNRVSDQSPYLKDLNCHCLNPDYDLVFNPAAWQDVPAGQWGFGAGNYSDYRNFRQPSEQASLGRLFRIKEKMSLQIRAEFFNVFNRLFLPNPAGTPTTAVVKDAQGRVTNGFGFINKTAAFGQRNGQLVARFSF